MKIKPLNNMIVVEPLLPSSLGSKQGIVIAVGNENKDIKVGDKVVLYSHGYIIITIENKDYIIVSQSNILAVLGE